MHQIRQALRGKGQILMGKNTLVRRAVRLILADHPDFERFLPHVRGNVGFVFTSADLKDVRDIIVENKVAAPAKAGAVAPNDVYVPAGNTGMEPGKTSFFQALNIPTKIARGTIEIVSDIHLVPAGQRSMLRKLPSSTCSTSLRSRKSIDRSLSESIASGIDEFSLIRSSATE